MPRPPMLPPDLAGTLQPSFRLGVPTDPGSVQWKKVAGKLAARNATDTTFARVQGAAPVDPEDLATMGWSQTEINAAVTFARVADAIGSQAPTDIGKVLKTDGAGGGTVEWNTQHFMNTLFVGPAGTDVHYNTIKDAIAAAVLGGVGPGNPWVIIVTPGPASGEYFEDNSAGPIEIPTNLTITTVDSIQGPIKVGATSPNFDLFIARGGSAISGLHFVGAVGFSPLIPTVCSLRISDSFPGLLDPVVLYNCVFAGAAQGSLLVIEAGCTGICLNTQVECVTALAPVLGSAVLVTGLVVTPFGPSPSKLLSNSLSVVTSPVVVFFLGGNPIQTGLEVTGGAVAQIATVYFDLPFAIPTATGILANNGSNVLVIAGSMNNCANALKVGSVGANTSISANAGYFGNLNNFVIDSATGSIFANGILDDGLKKVITPGGLLTGVVFSRGTGQQIVIGDSRLLYLDGEDESASIGTYLRTFGTTGLASGGVVTDGGGLTVDVSAGTGWSNDPDSIQDLTWIATLGIVLDANATNYVFVDKTLLPPAPATSTSFPGPTQILLAIAVTDGAGITYLHTSQYAQAYDPLSVLYQWMSINGRFTTLAGLTVTPGVAPAKQFQVALGNYLINLAPVSYAGSPNPAVFDSFLGGGVAVGSGINTLDLQNYDNAGVLTLMTDLWYRSDTVYLTSDGQLSVIYGTDEYLTQAEAEAEEAQPVFPAIEPSAIPIAALIVQRNTGLPDNGQIAAILDLRPPRDVAGGGGTAQNNHSLLANLTADDHPQYLLVTGLRVMTGDLDLGGFDINNVTLVGGVDLTNLTPLLIPGGAQALPTGIPTGVQVGAAPAEGVAASFARTDHQHGVDAAILADIATVSATASFEGGSTRVAPADHVHFHGTLASVDGGGTPLHALATIAIPGLMSALDKVKLDDLAPATTPNILPVEAVPTDGGAGPEYAYGDHQHGVATAAAVTITDAANAEGVSTSLSRADHTHAHGARGGGTQHAVATGATAGFMSAADKTKLDGIGSGGQLLQFLEASGVTLDPTTGAASFAQLPDMLINITVASGTNPIEVNFSGLVKNQTAGRWVSIALFVDAVQVAKTTRTGTAAANNAEFTLSLTKKLLLTAGAHTIAIYWRAQSNTGTATGQERILTVKEFSS